MIVGPFSLVSGPQAEAGLDSMLPEPNSLRRASTDAKFAVAAAARLLATRGVSGRIGVYVGQQRGSLEYLFKFVSSSYREGPRLVSPLLFSESVPSSPAAHIALTFGFRGVVETFVGGRTAGISALMAAREDLQARAVDCGLVVVLGLGKSVVADAYSAVYRGSDKIRIHPGAVAFIVRRPGAAEGLARLVYAGIACFGRGLRNQERALAYLPVPRKDCVVSAFGPARGEAIRALGLDAPLDSGRGESFALDPFLLLLSGSKAVLVLGEEGSVGLLIQDGTTALV